MSSSEKVEAAANLGRTLVCAAAAVGEHQLFDHLLFQKITSTRAPPLLHSWSSQILSFKKWGKCPKNYSKKCSNKNKRLSQPEHHYSCKRSLQPLLDVFEQLQQNKQKLDHLNT